MNAFISSNYSLVKDDLIILRVKAKNSNGWALDYSDENIVGVLVMTVPDAPVNPPRKGSSSSET